MTKVKVMVKVRVKVSVKVRLMRGLRCCGGEENRLNGVLFYGIERERER